MTGWPAGAGAGAAADARAPACAAAAAEATRGLPSNVTADLCAEVTLAAEELRERMSGNLCRCGAYNGIIDAVRETFVEEPA